MHLPRPIIVEAVEVELPIDGCGPPGSACVPPVDICAGAATWLQPTCHNQRIFDHKADAKTLQVLNQVSAWLVSAHTLPGGLHFPPPIPCKIIFTIILYKIKCKKGLLHKIHGWVWVKISQRHIMRHAAGYTCLYELSTVKTCADFVPTNWNLHIYWTLDFGIANNTRPLPPHHGQ